MDELRRIRELAEAPPTPDPTRKAQARSELLRLAEQETEAQQLAPETEAEQSSWLEQLRRRWLRPVPAAGLAAAAILAVAGVGIVLSGPATDPPAELADPGRVEAPQITDPLPDEDPVELAASCTAADGRLDVAYPEDWFTPDAGEPGACRFFGEEEFAVDAAVGGAPLATLEVVLRPAPLEELLAEDIGVEETSREGLDVGEHPVIRQRLRTTGEGALPQGVWIERHLVDLGEQTLVVATQDEDESVLDERRDVLEEMVRNLRVRADP